MVGSSNKYYTLSFVARIAHGFYGGVCIMLASDYVHVCCTEALEYLIEIMSLHFEIFCILYMWKGIEKIFFNVVTFFYG